MTHNFAANAEWKYMSVAGSSPAGSSNFNSSWGRSSVGRATSEKSEFNFRSRIVAVFRVECASGLHR